MENKHFHPEKQVSKAVISAGEMAQQSTLNRDNYLCSICLELLSDPVCLSCGHSYCRGCMSEHWDKEDVKAIYSCPQCRQTFTPRPALVKNTVLADLMEDLKRSGLQDDPSNCCYAGHGDVACDLCTGRKTKAVKSCLVCLVSFCEQHVQSHYQVAGLKRHKLVEPSAHLQDNICPRHDEVIKIFCRQDGQGICYLCAIDEHKGHDTISAQAERNKRQIDLSEHQKAMQERIQNIEDDVEFLQQVTTSTNQSADQAIENADRVFDQLSHCIERRRSKVKEEIRTKERTEVGRVVDRQNNLEEKLTEMKRSVAALDTLAQTEDHIHFLQNYPQNLSLSEYTGLNRDVPATQYFGKVTVALSKTQDQLDVFLNNEMSHFSQAVAEVDVLLPTQPPQPPEFNRAYLNQQLLYPGFHMPHQGFHSAAFGCKPMRKWI